MIQVLEKVSDVRLFIGRVKCEGKTVGFVPTMGALHEGHLTLMRAAKKNCDVVVVSIFVNPTQFGPNEDYNAYPRTWQKDIELCQSVGVDAVFHPQVAEMYPERWGTWVEVEGLGDVLCGRSRPGHFRGVTTVVTKLFNIVRPDKAFFGQKDAQQVVILMKMVRDLNMPLEIVIVPIVRDEDGLAKSSRNTYLTSGQREAASVLHKALQAGAELAQQGERNILCIRDAVHALILSEPLAAIDYVEIYSFPELEPVVELKQTVLIAVAAKFGTTRLIDNIIITPEEL